jgi:hypothetical protein
MKIKIYTLLWLCGSLLSLQAAKAQCPTNRYLTQIFPAYTVDTVTYSTPYSLQMDIYQPTGDTMAHRPVIVLAHGGAFVTTGGGREDDPTIIQLCQNFVRMGYVVANIDYRLTAPFNMTSAPAATDEVAKAISDGKAAIRYFRQDAYTTNTYRIDTNHIFAGGNSAGAVLYMNAGYVDSLGECSTSLQATFNANGGLEGNSGNPGYSSHFKAVINLAGALDSIGFVGPNDIPSVNAQGDQDETVPYECGYPLNGLCPVTLCGLGRLEPAYDSNNIYHMSHVFAGQGHVPWSSDTAIYDTMQTMVIQFLYSLVCTNTEATPNILLPANVTLYPNPATGVLHITASETLSGACVYDITGRVITNVTGVNADKCQINTVLYKPGIYFVKILFANNNFTAITRKFTIE